MIISGRGARIRGLGHVVSRGWVVALGEVGQPKAWRSSMLRDCQCPLLCAGRPRKAGYTDSSFRVHGLMQVFVGRHASYGSQCQPPHSCVKGRLRPHSRLADDRGQIGRSRRQAIGMIKSKNQKTPLPPKKSLYLRQRNSDRPGSLDSTSHFERYRRNIRSGGTDAEAGTPERTGVLRRQGNLRDPFNQS